jgi:hypothetical protein
VRKSLVVIALAAAFGGADQYLGSLSAHPSATAVSLLSAPWLLVAFAAGWTQPTPRRAIVLGVVSTVAALCGYWLTTVSPVEGGVLTVAEIRGLLIGQGAFVVGAFVTGPIFGWLGHRWRTDRWAIAPLVVAAALCFEPLAHAAVGSAIRSPGVWMGEVAIGLLVAAYVAAAARLDRIR